MSVAHTHLSAGARSGAKRIAIKRRSLPEDIAIGQRIRARRMELKMSQMDLADRIGLTFQQVQKYEKGSNRISCGMLMRIAAALELPPAALLGAADTNAAASLGERMTTTRQGCAMATLWNKLEKPARQALIDLGALLA